MSHAYEKDEVLQIINSVIEKVGKEGDISKDVIYHQLMELQKIIEDTRSGIGLSGAADITGTHIPVATDELDAVIAATAEATGGIMDACEVIEARAAEIGGAAGAEIAAQVTRIYEACSFQDITGQRISKVVNALKNIEIKVGALLDVMARKIPGLAAAAASGAAVSHSAVDGDDGLLNGPQLPGGGISQEEIDKLLDSFD